MKRWIALISCVLMLFVLAACGSSASGSHEETEGTELLESIQTSEETKDTEVSDEAEGTEAESFQETENADKAAVVYFSGTGTTEKIAKQMAEILGADLYEIVPEEEYSSDDLNYHDDNCRANKEQNDEMSRPAISNDLSAVSGYKTIYLGHPIWLAYHNLIQCTQA